MRAKHSLSLRIILSLKIGPQGGTQAYRGPLLPTLSRPLELSTGCSLRLCAADRTKSEVGKRPLLLLFLLWPYCHSNRPYCRAEAARVKPLTIALGVNPWCARTARRPACPCASRRWSAVRWSRSPQSGLVGRRLYPGMPMPAFPVAATLLLPRSSRCCCAS